MLFCLIASISYETKKESLAEFQKKSARRDSNPRPSPWQGDTPPLSHSRIIKIFDFTKRVMGIEPTYLAWKASVLPLNYTRINIGVTGFEPATSWSQTRRSSQAEPHPGNSCAPCHSRSARIIIL